MAILMIAEVAGQTLEGYEATLAVVADKLRQAPGFMMHTAHPTATGWRVIEMWQSREDSGRFFAANIAPNLPKGVHPKVTFEPVHDAVFAYGAA